jgi:hypothetical protein
MVLQRRSCIHRRQRPTLTLNNVQTSQAGVYHVVVSSAREM